jgi:hypothetical protein
LVDRLFAKHGARKVIYFRQAIDQRFLAPVIQELQSQLQKPSESRPVDLEHVLRQSLEELRTRLFDGSLRNPESKDGGETKKTLKDDLERLRAMDFFDGDVGCVPQGAPALGSRHWVGARIQRDVHAPRSIVIRKAA